MQEWIRKLAELLGGPIMVWGAAAVGTFLTVKSGFVQIRYFKQSLCHVFGGLFKKKSEKGVSSFQAVTAALAGTLGTGNIAGVAAAVFAGGPGAIFWMWISAFLGMATKYTEITLAVRHRIRGKNGYIGGPMYYLSAKSGVLFSVLCLLASFGAGNIVQSNTAFCAMRALLPNHMLWPHLMMAVAAIATIGILSGGFGRVARVTEKLLPGLAVFYIAGCMAVILLDIPAAGRALLSIFHGAFSFQSAAGGVGGYLFMRAIRTGCAKGIFTNEAGLGSAPIAHAAANCRYPAEQGLWGIFEVFFDTIVMCTLTGIVVISANPGGINSEDGVAVTMSAFSNALGHWSAYLLGFVVLLFAFASILAWGSYGAACITYLGGTKRALRRYRILYGMAVYAGAVLQVSMVWDLADVLNGMMMLPNLCGLVWLSSEMREETKRLFVKKSCEKRRKGTLCMKKSRFQRNTSL